MLRVVLSSLSHQFPYLSANVIQNLVHINGLRGLTKTQGKQQQQQQPKHTVLTLPSIVSTRTFAAVVITSVDAEAAIRTWCGVASSLVLYCKKCR